MSDIFKDLEAAIASEDVSEAKRLHDQRPRTVIVDFNHLAHKYTMGMPVQLITPVTMPDGTVKNVVTNIQNGTGKAFNRWARGGKDRLAVCFDRPTPLKKRYIKQLFGDTMKSGYKGGRGGGLQSEVFESIEMTQNLLRMSGVSCYASPEYEADDLIMACVKAAKEAYPGDPIDIITNDMDLVPLVDEDVSVFLQSKSGTYAQYKWLEKLKYEQITPENYAAVMSKKSAMKGLEPDYNTALLIKMLRGDSSDDIPASGSRYFTPTKVRQIQDQFREARLDMANTFRFDGDLDRMSTLLSSVVLSGEAADAYQRVYAEQGDALNSLLFPEFGVPRLDVLGLTQEEAEGGKDGLSGLADIAHTRRAYRAMNLNQTFTTFDGAVRKEARLAAPPANYDEGKYIQTFSTIRINVPTN